MSPDFSLLPPPPPPVPNYAPLPPAPAAVAFAPVAGPPPAESGVAGDLPVVDFSGMWQALKRRWWLPVLTGLLATGAVGAYLWQAPRFYTATAELAVDQEKSTVLPGSVFRPEDLKSLQVLKSIEREITGQGLLLRVANKHNLRADPTFAPPKKSGEAYEDDEVVFLLKKRVSAVLEPGTRHIAVAVDDTDAQRAKEVCESILTEATRQSADLTSETCLLARKSLLDEKARVEAKLAASQKKVDDFRAGFPSLPLDERQSDMKTNTVEDALRSAGIASTNAAGEVARLDNNVKQIEAAGGQLELLLRLPEIGQREEVVALKRSLGEKQAAFAVIDAEYGPKHPRHQQAVKEIGETSSQLASAVGRAVASMGNRLAKARQDAAGLTSELARRKQDSIEFAKVAGQFATLVSDLRADRVNYDRVLTSLKEVDSSSGLGSSVLRIVDAPLKPTYPMKPRRKLLTGAMGVAGFSLGLGLVLALHFLDRTLRNIQAGENLLHLPGLAALPADPAPSLKAALLHDRPTALKQSEAFRSLRTALSILGKGASARSYLFTSAREGEGTSYTAMNFALSLAQQGYRTLLIDANLRHPSLDKVFLNQTPATGLADHLSGQGTRDASACQRTAIPGVYVFFAGVTTRHPSEVLNEQAFALLLQDAAKWFHKIVIDTPPVGQVTDALPLARHVDSVCLVIRAASTPKTEVLRAANKLKMAGAHPAGFILNAASQEALSGGFVGDFAAGFTPAPAVRALPAPSAT